LEVQTGQKIEYRTAEYRTPPRNNRDASKCRSKRSQGEATSEFDILRFDIRYSFLIGAEGGGVLENFAPFCGQ